MAKKKDRKLNLMINEKIESPKVRLINQDGSQFGIVSKGDALHETSKMGLDLIVVRKDLDLPVCRMVNFGEYKYREDKINKRFVKKHKKLASKEIRLKATIAKGDLEVKIKKIADWIVHKRRVKIVINLIVSSTSGVRAGLGYDVLGYLKTKLSDIAMEELPVEEDENKLCLTLIAKKQKRKQGIMYAQNSI